MRRIRLFFAMMAMPTIGCGVERGMEPAAVASRAEFGPRAAASPPFQAPGEMAASTMVIDGSQATDLTRAKESAAAGRKILYNANVDLVTEDLGALDAKLLKLVAAGGAYVADSDRSGSAGSSRRGTWKVRVPVDAYDPFVKGVAALGELVSLRANSQDVSEEYFDLDARQAAKKVEEQRLLKHLTESTGKLEDILAVERELSRVRTEIERMQGRLRALASLAALATVTITASEIKGYVPPQAPTLGTRVARAFSDSLDSLRELGESALIACVAAVPWLPLIALGLGLVLLIARRLMARLARVHLIEVPPPPRA